MLLLTVRANFSEKMRFSQMEVSKNPALPDCLLVMRLVLRPIERGLPQGFIEKWRKEAKACRRSFALGEFVEAVVWTSETFSRSTCSVG